MQFSNRHGLPQTLVNLAKRDTYSRGAAKISVTELIGSPRIRILRARHRDELSSDVSEGLWALMGRAIHNVIEAGADETHIAEQRLFAEINGWTVSGGVDLQSVVRKDGEVSEVEVVDYKFTSSWAVMNPKPDWERQLNYYQYLVETTKGWRVTALFIVAIVRDWSHHEAARNAEYPQAPMVVLPQRMWSPQERDAYVLQRVLIHQDAERRDQWAEALPECSNEERWMRPTTWAVMKEGRKSALRVFHIEADARAYSLEQPGSYVAERPGENVRCEKHCQVARWCEQFAGLKGGSA